MKLKNLLLSSVCAVGLISLVACKSSSDSQDSASNTSSSSEQTADNSEVNPVSVDSAVLHTIYFDFDKYDIRRDQESNASMIAKSMKTKSDLTVQIQGHTDDRGSVEYNMALGNRRALSLKKYLVTSGVKSARISTVSYGKERPVVTGQNEEAWAKNRRAEVFSTSVK